MTQEQLALRADLGVRTISLLADALNLPVEDRARFVAALRA
jgi:hypothetical protein